MRTSLLLALVLLASSARADVLTFVCTADRDDGGPFSSAVIKVDPAKDTVEMIKPDPRFAAQARITDAVIAWDYSGTIDAEADLFEGSIDRATSRAFMRYYFWAGGGSYQLRSMSGACRREK